jgi:hypothetical protein
MLTSTGLVVEKVKSPKIIEIVVLVSREKSNCDAERLLFRPIVPSYCCFLYFSSFAPIHPGVTSALRLDDPPGYSGSSSPIRSHQTISLSAQEDLNGLLMAVEGHLLLPVRLLEPKRDEQSYFDGESRLSPRS